MVMQLDDGRVVHDEVVGSCPKSECDGDLVPVTGWGAWTDERCTKCGCSWCFQVPRQISDIAVAAEHERARRALVGANAAGASCATNYPTMQCRHSGRDILMAPQGTPGWYKVSFLDIDVCVFVGGAATLRASNGSDEVCLFAGRGTFHGVHFSMSEVDTFGRFSLRLYSPSNGGEWMEIVQGDRVRDLRLPHADDARLAAAHERIAAMPPEKRQEAMRRASRSYSAPRTCVEHDGCTIDTEAREMVWPDGERWPTRTETR